MIVCPNCNHQNPDGAVQCEACYTPLPALAECPNCRSAVQSDASFCGQCGFDLRTVKAPTTIPAGPAPIPDYELTSPGEDNPFEVEIPDLVQPDPLLTTEPLSMEIPPPPVSNPAAATPPPAAVPPASIPAPVEEYAASSPAPGGSSGPVGSTQLQINQAQLLHVQTNTVVELPSELSIIHIGKPNERIPPNIDVSGFPSSEIVSRVHANIRVEGDIYYLEDVGSSNGTYINNMPLPSGNRHRLRPGDRIALGKGDKVTFIFQLT